MLRGGGGYSSICRGGGRVCVGGWSVGGGKRVRPIESVEDVRWEGEDGDTNEEDGRYTDVCDVKEIVMLFDKPVDVILLWDQFQTAETIKGNIIPNWSQTANFRRGLCKAMHGLYRCVLGVIPKHTDQWDGRDCIVFALLSLHMVLEVVLPN